MRRLLSCRHVILLAIIVGSRWSQERTSKEDGQIDARNYDMPSRESKVVGQGTE